MESVDMMARTREDGETTKRRWRSNEDMMRERNYENIEASGRGGYIVATNIIVTKLRALQ